MALKIEHLASSDRKRTLAAFCILAAGVLACFHPLSIHPADLLVAAKPGGRNDLTNAFLASRSYPRECLTGAGQLPFWNPFGSCGIGYWGDPQSAVCYPPNWLFRLIDAQSIISWHLVAHHLLAGVGTLLLCRCYGFGRAASTLSALAFAGSPYWIAHTAEGHVPQTCAVAWIPWAFLGYETFRGRPFRGSVAVAVPMALSYLGGHVQETFYLVLLLSGCVVVDSLRTWRSAGLAGGIGMVGGWLLALSLMVGLVAVELAPQTAFIAETLRGQDIGYASAGRIGADLASLTQLASPFALGDLASFRGPGEYYWETLCYFGTAPMLLAVLGVAGGWRRYPITRWTVLWVVAFAFAFGAGSPVFAFAYQVIPGLSLFRAPGRAFFFVALATAVLAAAGTEQILAACRGGFERRRRNARLGLLALGLLLVMAWVASWSQVDQSMPGGRRRTGRPVTAKPEGPSGIFENAWSACDRILGSGALAGAGLVALLFVASGGGGNATFLKGSLLLLVVLESSCFSGRILRTVPPASIRAAPPFLATLTARDPGARILAPQGLLSDREAWSHGAYKIQGYNPAPLRRYVEYIAAISGSRMPIYDVYGFEPVDPTTWIDRPLSLLGVRFAVLVASNPAPKRGAWKLIEAGRVRAEFTVRDEPVRRHDFAVYENPDPLPRAFVLGTTRIVRTFDDLRRIVGSWDPRRELLLERDVAPAGPRQSFAPATIVEHAPNRVLVEATLDRPGYLFLSECWFPGWTAENDGVPVPVLRANHAFRAVPLPAGSHRVTFRFEPPLLRLGAGVTLTTLLALAAVFRFRTSRMPHE